MKQYFFNRVIMRCLSIILLLFIGINNVSATPSAQQQFESALNALKSKNLNSFHELSADLQDYPSTTICVIHT